MPFLYGYCVCVNIYDDIAMKQKYYWFVAKKHGYGAELPIAWQGWLLSVLFIITVLLFSIYFSGFYRIAGIFCSAVIVCIIAYYKTKGGWRWQ